jgi:hypothetical protein
MLTSRGAGSGVADQLRVAPAAGNTLHRQHSDLVPKLAQMIHCGPERGRDAAEALARQAGHDHDVERHDRLAEVHCSAGRWGLPVQPMQGVVTRPMIGQAGAVVCAQVAEDLAKASATVVDAGMGDGCEDQWRCGGVVAQRRVGSAATGAEHGAEHEGYSQRLPPKPKRGRDPWHHISSTERGASAKRTRFPSM